MVPGFALQEAGDNNQFCWRNLFSCINLLRILNKLTKWKHSRTMVSQTGNQHGACSSAECHAPYHPLQGWGAMAPRAGLLLQPHPSPTIPGAMSLHFKD